LSEASDKDVLRVTKDASKDNLKRAMIRIRAEVTTNLLPIIHLNSDQRLYNSCLAIPVGGGRNRLVHRI